MRVLVTRPQPQADEWVARLREAGVDAAALPLIDIGPPADPAAVREAWALVPSQDLVMFVSPNAVQRFFALRPEGAGWPTGTWAGSTGPGTSEALRRAGVPDALRVEPPAEAQQFDSEALWAQLRQRRSWQGARALIVRGEGGRDWLAATLQAEGAQVSFVEAYRRCEPVLSPAQRAVLDEAVHRPTEHAWIFSSSEAIGHLESLAPGAAWGGSRAFASHPRIAARARQAGFGEVTQLPPDVGAVVQAVVGRS